jgi:murein DD-endopeptidase MepM/ murein hydrolase activator NlpD
MARTTRRWSGWRTGTALIAVGLAAGCSVYRPLDQGSTVPWASAARGGAAAGAQVAAVALAGDSYRVRPGDRLGTLADRFGVSVATLAQANGLEPPYVIRVGQALRIPGQAPGAGPADTMVAQRAGRPTALAAIDVAPLAPKRVPPAAVSKGQGGGQTQIAALDLAPPPRPKEVAAPAHAAAPPPIKEAAAPFPAAVPPPIKGAAAPVPAAVPPPINEAVAPVPAALPPTPKPAHAPAAVAAPAADGYAVRSGETLSGIAQRLDVGLRELAKANGIRPPYRVYAGQKLRVPGGEDAYRTTVVDLGDTEPRTVRLAKGTPPPLQGSDFLWPVNGKVIGKYGPIDQWRRRDGIDIAAPRGAPVLAAQDGIVAYAGSGIRGYGEMILLRHDQGYITTYAHNASVLVEVGDVVRRGQVIARVGDSGDATQSMLHFELRKGRQPIDPETRLVHDDKAFASAE